MTTNTNRETLAMTHFDSTLEFEGFKPFDHIAGSGLGTWTNFDCAHAIITTCSHAGAADHDVAQYWRELAEDRNRHEGTQDIDLDWYCERLEDHAANLLPPRCGFGWEDNEYRVAPIIEGLADELADADACAEVEDGLPEGNNDIGEYLLIGAYDKHSYYVWDHNRNDWALCWELG